MLKYEKFNQLIKKMDINKGNITSRWCNSNNGDIILTYHIFNNNKLDILINNNGIAKIK